MTECSSGISLRAAFEYSCEKSQCDIDEWRTNNEQGIGKEL